MTQGPQWPQRALPKEVFALQASWISCYLEQLRAWPVAPQNLLLAASLCIRRSEARGFPKHQLPRVGAILRPHPHSLGGNSSPFKDGSPDLQARVRSEDTAGLPELGGAL